MRMRSPNNIIEDSNISRIASSNSRALPSFSQMLARSKNNTNNYLNDNNDSNNSSVNQEFEFQMDNDSSSDYRELRNSIIQRRQSSPSNHRNEIQKFIPARF